MGVLYCTAVLYVPYVIHAVSCLPLKEANILMSDSILDLR